jgi:hypothetical protein
MKEYFECQCNADEHRIVFDIDEDGIFLSIFLEAGPWWMRLAAGIKYIFGVKSRYGHFECWLLQEKDEQRLLNLLIDRTDSNFM